MVASAWLVISCIADLLGDVSVCGSGRAACGVVVVFFFKQKTAYEI